MLLFNLACLVLYFKLSCLSCHLHHFILHFAGSLSLDGWKSKYQLSHIFGARFSFISSNWELLNVVSLCDAGKLFLQFVCLSRFATCLADCFSLRLHALLVEKEGIPAASDGPYLAGLILKAANQFEQNPTLYVCSVLQIDYFNHVVLNLSSLASLTMDGASSCKNAAQIAGLGYLYRHCFAHCLMLVLKDNHYLFPWLNPILRLIAMITKTGKLYRGVSVMDYLFRTILLFSLLL
jgi:hypothetical protein